MENTKLFEKEYEDYHVADQAVAIKSMIKYFLCQAIHNQYLITNILSHIIYYTYDLVKQMDESDISTKLGYKYTIITMKKMHKTYEQFFFLSADDFIEKYKYTLEVELRNEE